MAGDLAYKDKDVFNEMLFFCQLRGEDSTGVFTVPRASTEPSIIKALGTPDNLFGTTRYDKLSFFQSRAIIGHCRKATIGGIRLSNAHPFTYGDLTGVHNGTLKNWHYLPGDAEAIDSQTLYENMSRVGVRETIEAVDGAYALIWWDAADETLNVLRNGERPLHYAFSDDYSKILWASEPWMITIAAGRNGMKLADLTPKESAYTTTMSVEKDVHWKIKLGRSAKDGLKFLRESDGHVEKLEGGVNKATYVAPFRPPYQSTYSPFKPAAPVAHSSALVDDKLDDELPKDPLALPAPSQPATTNTAGASASTSSSSVHSPTTDETQQSPSSLDRRPTLTLVQTDKSASSGSCAPGGRLRGNGDLVFTEAEFDVLVSPQCIFCRTEHTFKELREEGKLGAWVDDDMYICSKCTSDDLAACC